MRRVLDLLFPLECVACGQPGAHCCPACLAAVPLAPRLLVDGRLRAVSAYPYAHPLIRRLLHDAKYEAWNCALPPLEALTRRWAAKAGSFFPAEAIVTAVPLHLRRLRQRGFNQAEALARALASATGRRSLRDLLERARSTRPQTEAMDRRSNVRNAFSCRKLPASLRGRPFLLTDDVWTSGATMRECAEALRAAGSGPVFGFALAWGKGDGGPQRTSTSTAGPGHGANSQEGGTRPT